MRSPLRAEAGGGRREFCSHLQGPEDDSAPGRLSHGQPMASQGPRGPEHDRDRPRALPASPNPAPIGAEAQGLWTGHVSSRQMV